MNEHLHEVFLGLGANMGDRQLSMIHAIDRISEKVGPIVCQSSFIESEPWGFDSNHLFLNAVVCCHTQLSPRQLLLTTQEIERSLGRKHKSVGGHYADRTIDIDILLYDNLHIDEPDLQIPHPLMHQRPFVMEPLAEVREKLKNTSSEASILLKNNNAD